MFLFVSIPNKLKFAFVQAIIPTDHLNNMNDSKISMTRLLFDGDGGGDDRRLNLLAKQVLKWTTSAYSNDATDEDIAKKIESDDDKQHASLLASVLNIHWNVQKTRLVQTMAANESKNYEMLYDQIKEEIEKAVVAIKDTKGTSHFIV